MADFLSVESSSIAGIAHEPETSTLRVKFQSGEVYHYDGVSADQFDAFVNAKSIGRHFHGEIRGKFPHTRQQTEKARPEQAAEPDVTTAR